MELPRGKTILSGIQPSGTLHIGNYLGALKQWVALQEGNTAYYCIVDEHAITTAYEPSELPGRVLDAAAMYVACGLDPKASVIFVQSHVPAHTELGWLLGTIVPIGRLRLMTQFKDKAKDIFEDMFSAGSTERVGKNHYRAPINVGPTPSLGLFAYPVLMAADILLYQADTVPVGEDQTQHIELTRNIAQRFNNRFGEVFTMPEALVNKDTARIMSLADPTRKMSKSDGEKSYVALTDDTDTIRTKIGSAITETEAVFSFTDSGPAVKNLLAIYQAFSGEESAVIEQRFAGSGYKEFKEALAEIVIEKLAPIQERYRDVRSDEDALRNILADGAERAAAVATTTLADVKEKMGLI